MAESPKTAVGLAARNGRHDGRLDSDGCPHMAVETAVSTAETAVTTAVETAVKTAVGTAVKTAVQTSFIRLTESSIQLTDTILQLDSIETNYVLLTRRPARDKKNAKLLYLKASPSPP